MIDLQCTKFTRIYFIFCCWTEVLLVFSNSLMTQNYRKWLLFICMHIWVFKGASTSKVIGTRNEMMMDDYDGQMIFEDLVGLKLPDIRLTGEEKPQKKNLTHEACPDRGSNPGPLCDRHACYHLFHSGGLYYSCQPCFCDQNSIIFKVTFQKFHINSVLSKLRVTYTTSYIFL